MESIRPHHVRRIALGLSCAAALFTASAAPASAETYRDYKVTAQGHGTLTQAATPQVEETDEGEAIYGREDHVIGFQYQLDLGEASVDEREVPYPVNLRPNLTSWDATGELTLDAQLQITGDAEGDRTCRGGGKFALRPDLDKDDILSREMTLTWADRSLVETVPRLDVPCGRYGYHLALPQFDDMKQTFGLPRGSRNKDTVVVPLKGTTDCRGPEDFAATHCQIDFDGAITFEYVRSREAYGPGPTPGGAESEQGGQRRSVCVVPKVKGLAQSRAVKKLKAAGCKVKVKRVHHRKVKRGRVVKASAKPGRRLRAGTVVTLSVSTGRR